MGMSAAFARWGTAARRAAFARPHVYPVLGGGGRALWLELLDSAPVVPAAGPRDADLLVLAGSFPEHWTGPLLALFETLALPRGALWLRPGGEATPPPLPLLGSFDAGDMAQVDWNAVVALLLDPALPANDPFLPEHPPLHLTGIGAAEVRGPALPLPLPDPEAPAPDELPVTLGPFCPGLPTGLALSLRLSGERIAALERVENLFPAARCPAPGSPTVSEVESARLSSHMVWMAELLDLSGLKALADAFRAARRGAERPWLERLFRAARRSGLKELQQGVGVITKAEAAALGLTGPVARASGLCRDARLEDPVYIAAGFFPQMEEEGDNWARWCVRERESREALRLIEVAGGDPVTVLEGPRGAEGGSRANLPALGRLPGMDWFSAIHFVASLDLCMEEAACLPGAAGGRG